jgi:hypothetical protein
MAVFNQLSKNRIDELFTHRGWFCGLVPVYVNLESRENEMAVRNWVPEFTLDLLQALLDFLTVMIYDMDPHHVPSPWPIKWPSRIDGMADDYCDPEL